MKIELLTDWQHEGGRVYPKGTVLDMHPVDGERLIKEKVGKKPGIIKQIKDKIDGDNR
jgi:hypothetical protein